MHASRVLSVAMGCVVLSLVTAGVISPLFAFSDSTDLTEPESLRGIRAVRIVLTTYGLENVRIQKEDLLQFVEQKLRGSDVRTASSGGQRGPTSDRDATGTLAITIRGRENPGTLGTRINSFAVTVQLVQPVILKFSGRSGHAATWTKTASGIVGALRPQPIRDALGQLLESFSREYRRVNPP